MKKTHIDFFPYLMILPAAAFITVFCVYPVFWGIFMSLTDTSLMNLKSWRFVGLENFIRIAGDIEFKNALGFTLIYASLTALLSYILGLLCALFMNRKIWLRRLVRALLLLPWVVPAVVGTTAWIWLLNDQTGFINLTLRSLGLIDSPILFLGSANMARFTVIMFSTWKAFPFMAVVLLASLQTIPMDIYEAADIDGANSLQILRFVTLPLIRRVSLLIILLQTIWTMNNFDNIFLMTMGGPAMATQVIPIYSYNTAFRRSSMGYASTISVVMMSMMAILYFIYFRFSRYGKEATT